MTLVHSVFNKAVKLNGYECCDCQTDHEFPSWMFAHELRLDDEYLSEQIGTLPRWKGYLKLLKRMLSCAS